MNHRLALLTLPMLLATGHAWAMSDADLAGIVRQRLEGDRTGACMAVAVVEKDHVARTFQCADPADAGRIGPDAAFEIGSVSKTMTATLLADLILQGRGSLDDTLASWLPEGTRVPDYQGQPILLRHVVTHTSGLPRLPPRLDEARMDDPYAGLDAEALLASLADVELEAAPGTRFAYSNFASMLLSYAVARRAGVDFETLLRERLFAPLGMDHAYIDRPPRGVRPATGHTPNRQPAPPWRFAADLAGVGGVRATLEDMVRYVQAGLGRSGAPIARAMAMTREPVSQTPPMGMNWIIAPVPGRNVLVHEGGTGGFSSFVALDPQRQRGVVVLSDTAWTSLGGLGSLANHLVDALLPLGGPRREVAPEPALLQALEGEYRLEGVAPMRLRQRDGKLFADVEGQGEFELGYDSAGDFYPLQFDALLRPHRRADGSWGLTWLQGGGEIPVVRADLELPSAEDMPGYAGTYPLLPGFSLTVREEGGQLVAQATGQGAFPLRAVAKDHFEAPVFGIEIRFLRDRSGEVASLELHQHGNVLRGRRQ